MDVFQLRKNIIDDYASYVRSFIAIRDGRIAETVYREFDEGLLWPAPLIQINPAFATGESVDQLVQEGVLHPLCAEIFRTGKTETDTVGKPLHLYWHQAEAIRTAKTGKSYVLTTGTGSGKSLSYIIPIVDAIVRNGSGKGITAIIVYPMNALANSQELELEKFLKYGKHPFPVSYRRYTGQEDDKTRNAIIASPPDILLTNYVMLELILTRPYERKFVEAAKNLTFLVFDELHTYRGRQGADVGMLIRRLRNTLSPLGSERYLQCIGTSATLAGPGSFTEQRTAVASVASKLFGTEVKPENIIVETLRSETPNTVSTDMDDAPFVHALKEDIQHPSPAENYATFVQRPLAIWIEHTLGVERNAENRLVRCKPRPIEGKNGLAVDLALKTNLSEEMCLTALKETLLTGYRVKNAVGKPVFAFTLHQFLSTGDTVYATLEDPEHRTFTLHGQQFAPDRAEARVLVFPLLFCRECGMEYYSVWKIGDDDTELRFVPRAVTDTEAEDKGIKGYLFLLEEETWPETLEAQLSLLPEEWLEEKKVPSASKKPSKTKFPNASLSATMARPHLAKKPIPQRHGFFPCLLCSASSAMCRTQARRENSQDSPR